MTPAPSSPVPAVEAVKLLPCPFCGGPASFEEVPQGMDSSWSVGCDDLGGGGFCLGFQSMTTFPRKSEAARAWNTRAAVHTPTPGRAAEPDTMGDPWVDTRLVSFDDTVMFGQGYDGFDQWDDFRMEMHVPGAGSYAVWGSGKKWSFYGGPNGVMAFERFGSRAEAQREAEDYALSVSEWGRTHHALRTRAETAEAQLATLRAEVEHVRNDALEEAAKVARRVGNKMFETLEVTRTAGKIDRGILALRTLSNSKADR